MKKVCVLLVMCVAAGFGVAAQAETTTLDAAADSWIWQWVNWAGDNMGADTSLQVGDYPSWKGQSWALFQWDLSGIPSTDTITGATFQIYQAYSTLPVNQIEVYGIDSGAWTEMGVTWNNFASSATATLLGTMPVIQGICTFSDSDLTSLVQNWVNGSHSNYGLVFKYHSAVGQEERPGWNNEYDEYFSNFYSRDYTTSGQIVPQLVVTHIPEPCSLLALFGLSVLSMLRRRK
jgi:hypothetical protein